MPPTPGSCSSPPSARCRWPRPARTRGARARSRSCRTSAASSRRSSFGGGDELPNDVTFEILDQAGELLPIQLPPGLWKPNQRPLPAADVELLANCVSVAFDASRSSDPDGDQLSYQWQFGDGATGDGRALVHQYPGPGTYHAALRLLDASGQVGDGAVLPLEVFLKRPPAAVTGPDLVVAPGEPVAFDGTARRPASGRSRAISGTSTTAAAARVERQPQLRQARPLRRHAAGRGRQQPALQLLDRPADRPGQRPPGRGRGRGPAASRSARPSASTASAATTSTARSRATSGTSATAPARPRPPSIMATPRPAPTPRP